MIVVVNSDLIVLSYAIPCAARVAGRGLEFAGNRGIECLTRYVKTAGWGFRAEYYSTATLSSSGRDNVQRFS